MGNPLLLVHTDISVNELLREEISVIELWRKKKEDIILPLILSSAKKLEPYVNDKRDICTILVKAFHEELERDIRRYCPPEYKRGYLQSSDDVPIDEVDEWLQFMAETLEDALITVNAIRAEYREADKDAQAELNQWIVAAFGSFAELKKRVEEWKDASVEMAKIKQIHDKRTKIDAFTKFMLRIQEFELSKNRIAELMQISSKWVKQGIENNSELDALAIKLWGIDTRWHVIKDWFIENKIRVEKRMKLKEPPQILCTSCRSKLS